MPERKPAVGRRIARPASQMLPAAAALTPKEVLGILRRHMVLIVFLTVLGLGAGGGSWYLLRKYVPKYTAQTLIKE
jgi:hypothetical protein